MVHLYEHLHTVLAQPAYDTVQYGRKAMTPSNRLTQVESL